MKNAYFPSVRESLQFLYERTSNMVQKIAFFNHKGGVGKTTSTFHVGWMLASKGKTTILVDADPQCNLTGVALGEYTEEDENRIENIYKTHSNIKTGLAPAFESQPKSIQPVDCVSIGRQDRLFLLPGHVGLAEYEVTLGVAQELSGSIRTLQNLPGSITDLLNKTAEKFNADYILIDMSPSLGAINQNLLMTSDFFLVPTMADFFSVMAIDSLINILPKWYEWAKQARALPILQEATYPFPEINLKFLGTIVQNFRIIRGKETKAFEKWIQNVENDVSEKLSPVLKDNNMLFSSEYYLEQGIDPNSFTLAKLSNFNSLIALSQQHRTPIYDLTTEQLGQTGKVLATNQEKQKEFRETFSSLADKIIHLSSIHETSH